MEKVHTTDNRFEDEIVALRQKVAELEKSETVLKRTEDALKDEIERLKATITDIIITLASTVDTKDPYKAGHQKRVAILSCAIAAKMGLSQEQTANIKLAALVHDIGKISVPAELLAKSARLMKSEYTVVKSHPRIGAQLLEKAGFPQSVALIVHQHHERMNGAGYPQGLSGEEILVESRILAVADVIEAIASQRSYRTSLGIDKALKEITSYTGRLYDPEVVAVCVHLFNEAGFNWDEKYLS